jgi:hypothetical protein
VSDEWNSTWWRPFDVMFTRDSVLFISISLRYIFFIIIFHSSRVSFEIQIKALVRHTRGGIYFKVKIYCVQGKFFAVIIFNRLFFTAVAAHKKEGTLKSESQKAFRRSASGVKRHERNFCMLPLSRVLSLRACSILNSLTAEQQPNEDSSQSHCWTGAKIF